MEKLILLLAIVAFLQTVWAQTTPSTASGATPVTGPGDTLPDLMTILGLSSAGGQGPYTDPMTGAGVGASDAFFDSLLGGLAQGSGGAVPGGLSPDPNTAGTGSNAGTPSGGWGSPKSQTHPASMHMMIPAMAISTGMDGPWGAVAMAQALQHRRHHPGMGSFIQNPVFLMNMVTGGDFLGF